MTHSEARRLTYQFVDLPRVIQVDIGQRLGLLETADLNLPDHEMLVAVLRWAAEREKLAELWEAIREAHAQL